MGWLGEGGSVTPAGRKSFKSYSLPQITQSVGEAGVVFILKVIMGAFVLHACVHTVPLTQTHT